MTHQAHCYFRCDCDDDPVTTVNSMPVPVVTTLAYHDCFLCHLPMTDDALVCQQCTEDAAAGAYLRRLPEKLGAGNCPEPACVLADWIGYYVDTMGRQWVGAGFNGEPCEPVGYGQTPLGTLANAFATNYGADDDN